MLATRPFATIHILKKDHRMKKFLALPILLFIATAAFGQGAFVPQEFKEFGFKVTSPYSLTHQPTETGTDSNGKQTKIDSFDSKVIDNEMYVIQVTTFTTDISKGVDYNYLGRMLESTASASKKIGKIHYREQPTQGDIRLAIPAAWTTWTIKNDDGTTMYIHEQVCVRGNRMYILRQAYRTPSDDMDTAWLAFYAMFDLP
jgi:hypothetical protein